MLFIGQFRASGVGSTSVFGEFFVPGIMVEAIQFYTRPAADMRGISNLALDAATCLLLNSVQTRNLSPRAALP